MRRAIFTTVIILVLSGIVSGYETSVSWIEGSNPPDFTRTPEYPTTNDLIYFTIPTNVYGNFLAAEQSLGGVPTLSINPATRTVELYFQPPAPGGSSPIYEQVCGLEGYFGQLEAGSWLFYVHFQGTLYIDDFDVTSTPSTPVISGNIMSNNGRPISGVTMAFSSGGGSTTTNNNGDYAKSVPYNWSGSAVPSKSGYTFSPSFRSYVNVTSNRPNQNYMGFGEPPPVNEYFTEHFLGGEDSFDLEYQSITFTPSTDGTSYSAYLQEINELPVNPLGGINLGLGDDNFQAVQLDQAYVTIYGTSFSIFYVGSNGYITFTEPDPTYSQTLTHHFDTMRISALLTDLNPSAAGQVSAKQLPDRVAVTWENVQEFSGTNINTFQIVMYFDGRLQISWTEIDARSGIAGISAGNGIPPDFEETDLSELNTQPPPPPPPVSDYFTEQFSSIEDSFDLSYKSIMFTPSTDDASYDAYLQEITQLPTNPFGGMNLGLVDDSFVFVQLDSALVSLYGTSFTGFYVGSNGYITFTQGDQNYSDTLSTHFNTMRISGLFRDLNPTSIGQVSVKQLVDRVAVTWENVVEYNTGNVNTFQIEMYFDGRIRLSWLAVGTQYCIVGLSAGTGLPTDFEETDLSELGIVPPPPPPETGYLTEQFSGGDDTFDLSHRSIMFTPASGGLSYGASIQEISQLPTDPAGGKNLALGDDDSIAVTLSSSATVSIYGNSFSTFYVGSNGYITFTDADEDYSETLADHFDTRRISTLFKDLNPSAAGQVSWKQTADRVAVTWENVPQYSSSSPNTFQIEMYFDGRIQISWLAIAAQTCIVGLSDGLGLPDDFVETDFSELGTEPPPQITGYLTEQFSSNEDAFDLSYTSIIFTPTAGGLAYGANVEKISVLPTDPAGGKTLTIGDDASMPVTLSSSATVSIYGSSFSTFYVGSNGYLTFTEADLDYSESLADHFDTRRISALFKDLNPSATGLVSWKQLADRVAVTWQNVPEYGSNMPNTFQVVMYFDGRLQISWLEIAAQMGIVGLSDGLGVPEDFKETDLSELGTEPPPVTGYSTEQFTSGDDAFDLSFTSVMFTPASDGISYSASVQNIAQLPTNPAGGKNLSLGDDASISVTLSSSAEVSIFGNGFSTFYVGSNGFLTFTEADLDYSESLADHFDTLRISGLFVDLNPSASGQVSWKQLTDRVAVTWQNVQEYRGSNSNTFQIEMYFDGRIQISWLAVAAQSGIVGLSDGLDVPDDFEETDFSELGTEPPPLVTGYSTEQFTSGEDAFDLSYTSITFTPTSDETAYSTVVQNIAQLPTSPTGGKNLSLGDDASISVTLSSSAAVSIFGSSFSTFYVGSNGYITFSEADQDYSESLADHFDTRRISALFKDLNPSATGQVSWKQLVDRVAVTWQNVPDYGSSSPNTLQVVMYFDGRIQISWLAVAAQSGIVGLSDGLGVPDDFEETDFSELN